MNGELLSEIVYDGIEFYSENLLRMITRAYILVEKKCRNKSLPMPSFDDIKLLIKNKENPHFISSKIIEKIGKENFDYTTVYYMVDPEVANLLNLVNDGQINENLNILLTKAGEYITSKEHLLMIARAYLFAEEAHKGQSRKSKEPYIIHPFNVALKGIEEMRDAYTIAAELLHDCEEDTKTTHREISFLINPIVADLVEGVTRGDKKNKEMFPELEDEFYYSTRKMFEAMNRDIRVVLIKLADRHHNTFTLKPVEADQRDKTVAENFDEYIWLADLVGNYKMRCELEDESFKWKDPEKYEFTKELIEREYQKRKDYFAQIETDLKVALIEQGISAEIEFRPKTIYSTHQRIMDHRDPLTMHDLFAFIVKTDKEEDCVRVYDILSKMYTHVSKKFKDYRYEPKYNYHRSLHTTVRTMAGPAQFQICTHEMHQVNEYGITPPIDENGVCDMDYVRSKLKYYKILNEILETEKDDRKCVERIKKELLVKKINVYSITGDAVILPENATTLDFLSQLEPAIITQIGKIVVNDEHVYGLNHRLHNRDTISYELVTPHDEPIPITIDLASEAVTHSGRQYVINYFEKAS